MVTLHDTMPLLTKPLFTKMMRYLNCIVFCALCSLSTVAHAEENPDGLSLELISLGGTMVEVRVVHQGEEPLYLLNLFDVPFHMLAFKITDAKGERVNFRGALTKLPFEIENVIYLQPSGFFGMKLDLMKLKRPASGDNKESEGKYELTQGTYTVRAVYDMRGMKSQFEGLQLWDGRLESEPITIKLEKTDQSPVTIVPSNAIKVTQ